MVTATSTSITRLNHWSTDPRWSGITRPYSYSDVVRLRGSIQIEYTLARLGSGAAVDLMHADAYVPALGAITGNQAMNGAAGLKAIYGTGGKWLRMATRLARFNPDQSLYPCDSRESGEAHQSSAACASDQIESAEGKKSGPIGSQPIVADAEAGLAAR